MKIKPNRKKINQITHKNILHTITEEWQIILLMYSIAYRLTRLTTHPLENHFHVFNTKYTIDVRPIENYWKNLLK